MRGKKLTNMRASGADKGLRIAPAKKLSIEEYMEWIADNEYLEVTPKSLRVRKSLVRAYLNGMYDIIVLTQEEYIAPTSVDWYIKNVLDEDNYVLEALRAEGLKVEKKDWADPDFDWSTTKSVIFRTTWDYFDRYPEFELWLAKVSSLSAFQFR